VCILFELCMVVFVDVCECGVVVGVVGGDECLVVFYW